MEGFLILTLDFDKVPKIMYQFKNKSMKYYNSLIDIYENGVKYYNL